MSVVEAIHREYSELNTTQLKAVGLTEGPLLVIAGPGSGKTLVLVMRALNILLQGLTEPRGLLVCTFTEKAAFELRDRISTAAKKLKYAGDLSELLVGTIHGVCNDFLMIHRHHTPLGNNYEVLDELTQLLFLFDNFDTIIGPELDGKYLNRWTTRWTAIEGARNYFDKITEELIESEEMAGSPDPFVRAVGMAYLAYESALFEKNCIDFAHQQKLFYQLLQNATMREAITNRIKYVMVDEYQDTNFVQEQILLQLACPGNNICVVGDEDQSMYRFRGATVRNILEFQKKFDTCKVVKLTVNYRSHKDIVRAYNKFMASCNWSNPGSPTAFRYDKGIVPAPDSTFPEYPAVFCIWGESRADEASRLADLIYFLKDNRVIEDYGQVALLLHSVRLEHSERYITALEDKGIPVFCPRARAYFENEEIHYMVACFAILFGYYGEQRGEPQGKKREEMASYIDNCITDLGRNFADPHPLSRCIQEFESQIRELKEGETLDRRLADYFYQFLAHEPFASMVNNENRARNLAIFSQLLNIFQNYYHYAVVSHRNRDLLRLEFFNSFLRLLYIGGINEYEDPDQPFPKGHVQVMTIHQAKGLEFPVVIVGSLDKQLSSPKDVDRHLSPFYHREPFEPENRITIFDRMRLHYVAFSRAEKILALTSTEQPKSYFNPIWQGLPQWPYVRQDLLKALFFRLRRRIPLKKTFSFTTDLKVFETCPRQYQFFRDYDFTPARSAEIFFGALVHQTIEDIHRQVLESQAAKLEEKDIRGMFDSNFSRLANSGIRPIGQVQRESAFSQVMNYFRQNRASMERIIETEVDVSVEKDNYILTGKIDLLLGSDDKLELLDFKSQPRPREDDARLDSYYKQLCVYAHILEQRYDKKPERVLLYWTGEPRREEALMEFPYRPDEVEEAGAHFDRVVEQILEKDYQVRQTPEGKVCQECDLRVYCRHQGTIKI
ncbi:ATP-dependent helicase [Dehalococcoidia bacterium]|nr:ATP-dependent helicase [Dehalococcoidia bacterium]MCL0064621.1 ATP-dependent helicase [Dehalococcoidia bacterium]